MSKVKVWEKKSFWLILLGILCVAIVGLGAGIVMQWRNTTTDEMWDIDEYLDTKEAMAGWDGPISDSTRASILTSNIKNKLSSDPDYNPPQAVDEYKFVYDRTTGNLKVYVAIEYASYVYKTYNDLDLAVGIMNNVMDFVNAENEEDYYSELYYIYNAAGYMEQADYYHQIIDEKARNNSPQKEPNI